MGTSLNERWVILSAVPVTPAMKRYLQPGDYVVACDAGYRNAEILGIQPQLVLGDFDSAPQPVVPDGEQMIVLPHIKDDTDTHYAARLAVEQGAKRVLMLGALGGARLEHTLANLGTGLYLEKQGMDVLLANERTEVRYLRPEHPLTLNKENWQYLSVFPLEGTVRGVDIEGAFYPLQNATLTVEAASLSVSNEFAAPTLTLRCSGGSAAVLLTMAD